MSDRCASAKQCSKNLNPASNSGFCPGDDLFTAPSRCWPRHPVGPNHLLPVLVSPFQSSFPVLADGRPSATLAERVSGRPPIPTTPTGTVRLSSSAPHRSLAPGCSPPSPPRSHRTATAPRGPAKLLAAPGRCDVSPPRTEDPFEKPGQSVVVARVARAYGRRSGRRSKKPRTHERDAEGDQSGSHRVVIRPRAHGYGRERHR